MSLGRVLVTGATGFIGSNFVRALLFQGAEVAVLCRKASSLARLEMAGILNQVQIVQAELCDVASVTTAVSEVRPHMVYHLAAYGVRAEAKEVDQAVRVNVAGAANLLSACERVGTGRLVWMGSGFEYAVASTPIDEAAPLEPATFYGASKLAGWMLADFYRRARGMDIVTVRLFSAFGRMEHPSRFIPYVITQGLRGKAIQLTAATQERDYLYVDDISSALWLLGTEPRAQGEIYNLGSGEPSSIRHIAELIAESLPQPVDLRFGALDSKRAEASRMIADTGKIRTLGWAPKVALAEGLKRTMQWYDENRESWGHL